MASIITTPMKYFFLFFFKQGEMNFPLNGIKGAKRRVICLDRVMNAVVTYRATELDILTAWF